MITKEELEWLKKQYSKIKDKLTTEEKKKMLAIIKKTK